MDPKDFEAALGRLGSSDAAVPTEGMDPAAFQEALSLLGGEPTEAPPPAPAPSAPIYEPVGDAMGGVYFNEGQGTETPGPSQAEKDALTPGHYVEKGEPGLGTDPTPDVAAGLATGALKSVFETKDFLFGAPEDDEKSGFRQTVEGVAEVAKERSGIIGGLSVGIGQFAAGMFGLGKVASLAKALPWFGRAASALEATKAGRAAGEIGKAATVGAVAFDPHEERLSNLIQDGPLANPLTRFLAADPEDSAAEGRLKAALESIGVDLAIIGTLAAGAKVYKALSAGDTAAAERLTVEAEAAVQENLRAIQADNQNLSRSRGIIGSTEALPQDGSQFAMPTPGNASGSVPQAANSDIKTPNVRADNDQPAPRSDGTAAVAMEEPREGYATQGAYPLSSGQGAPAEAANANSAARRDGGNDNAPFGPAPKQSARSGPELTADEEVALEVGGLGGTQAPKGRAKPRPMPANGNQDLAVTVVPNQTEGLAQAGIGRSPSGRPRIQFADEDTAAVLDGMTSDADAMAKYGGWEQAIENGHTFGRGAGVPYAKLATDADQAQFMARVVDAAEERIATIKGGEVLKDARVQQMVNQRAALFNDDPASVLGMIQQSGQQAARMVADMEAGYLVTSRMLQDTYSLAQRIKIGDFSEFGSMDAAVAELKRRLSLASSAYAGARSITANAGRAVRRMRKDFELKPEDVAKLQSMDGNQLVEVIASTGGNARQLAQAANPSWWDKTVDYGQFLLINNLVSGPKTQLINAVTNAYMIGARPMERIIGSVPGVVAGNPTSRAILRESVQQYTYLGAALVDGFTLAKRAFMMNDSVLAPHRTELYRGNQGAAQQGLQWKPWTSTGNVLHNALLVATTKAIGMPTRTLGFVDELVKQTVYRSKVMARAHMEASERLAEAGIEGAAAKQFMRDYITDRLDNAFDDMGRGVDPDAIREAQIATFQQDLLPGTFGKVVVQPAVANFPALRLILPFVKTPTNVIRYGWKMTPVLNLLQKEYRQMLSGSMGPEVQAQAVGQMAMGSLFMGAAAYLVSQGTITGGGPKDYKLKQELLATGWQPYSLVRENEDGTKTYLPFNRYDPIAIPFGIVADLQDAINNLGDDADERTIMQATGDAMGALTIGLAKQFTSKSYLTGISQAMDFMADPEARAGPFAGQMVANFIPFSAALRQGNPDPYLREARGVADRVLNTIPGLSERVPARFDAFGDPIVARKGLWSSDEDALVDREMQRLAIENGAAPVRVSPTPEGGIDLRDLTLSDGRNAYAAYQEWSGHIPNARRSLKEVVAAVIRSPAYQAAPDGDINTKGTKLNLLSRPIAKYRAAAMKMLKADPVVRAAFMKEKLRVRDAYREARRKQAEQRPSIGEAFGQEIDAMFGDQQQ